jgi:hypothetical protein
MKFLSGLLAIGISLTVFNPCTKNIEVKGSGNFITTERMVSSFTGIEITGDFKVIVMASNFPTITLRAEDNIAPEIETKVEGGILKLRFRKNLNVKHGEITIAVGDRIINSITQRGSGTIKTEYTWANTNTYFKISGSGSIQFNTKATNVKAEISGSGNMTLGGEADKLDFHVSGSGNIYAYPLIAKQATTSISGSGLCELMATEKLQATISGSGSVYVKGNPAEIIKNITGTGGVVKQ